jgi:hypothetical protein
MTETREVYVTSGAEAFLKAFVVTDDLAAYAARLNAARFELAAWRRAAEAARHHEGVHLTAAEHWRTERFECEARARDIAQRFPELATDESV